MFILNAVGTFKLSGPEGRDVTPRSTKARGLLALLAMSAGHRRSRLWLQSKLWSDQSPEKAAHNLRQTAWLLRRAVRDAEHVLIATRSEIALDPNYFTVSFDPAPNAANFKDIQELFEDLDVHDGEFENWLRDQRSAFAQQSSLREQGSSVTVFLSVDAQPHSLADIFAKVVSDDVVKSLAEFGGINVIGEGGFDDSNHQKTHIGATTIRLYAAEVSQRVFLSAEVVETRSRNKVWSSNLTIDTSENDPLENFDIVKFSRSIVERTILQFAGENSRAISASQYCAEVVSAALKLVFRLDKISLNKADKMLRHAYEVEPLGQYLAWRMFLRDLAFFQHRSIDFLEDRVTTETLCHEALLQTPESSIVQIIAAQYRYISQGQVSAALGLAESCIQWDRTNPLAWAILSNILAASERQVESYQTALKAISLSSRNFNTFFFEHFACMAAVSGSDYERAVVHAEKSLAVRPEFVSPLRYKVALDQKLHRHRRHQQSVQQMRRVEPNFKVLDLLDPNYPVNTMRRLPLIDSVK